MFEDMNYSGAKFWLDAGQLLFTTIIGLYVWLSKGPKENKKDLDALKVQVDEQQTQIEKIELKLEYIPTKDEFHALDNKVTGLVGQVDSVHGRMRSIEGKLDLLIENELRGNTNAR
ncbi:DUF2730 family protein [Rheinheimera sp. KL1]|uniref:DUF2730 family protein n=1 Tax=Rheinheimera sp. KL1 TaxID=1635005 RepID=UPI00126636D6|nr:DUF2730 family protein [Rheinheimera sp. KL1]